jgi:hypothetical protein
MTVYVMGESHTEVYDCFPRIVLVGRDGVRGESVINSSVSGATYPGTGDVLIVVVGEIDCRCHMYIQIHEKHREEDEVIRDLAVRFINSLIEYRYKHNANIGVRGIVPPFRNAIHHDEKYPIRGTFDERVRWRQKLNAKLQWMCHHNDILFIPSPAWAENTDGSMNHDVCDDFIHIHNRYARRICEDLTFTIQYHQFQH